MVKRALNRTCFLAGFWFLATLTLPASELGHPFLQVYTRLDHGAHAQFWAPFQSPEGLMYFGNQLAVLEYDGRTWRVLKIPPAFVRAMAAAPNGDIYVGHEEQIGVLAKPDSGPPRYTSLLEKVPATARPFGTVRDVRVWRGDVFFATDKNVLRWRAGEFTAWPLAGDFRNRLFVADDRLILHRQGDALYEFDGAGFKTLSRAPELAQSGYSFVVAAPGGELLLGLDDRGLFRVGRDGALTPWAHEAAAILRRTAVLTGLRLRDGAVAVGTVSEGVLLLGADGALLRQVTRESGLPQDSIISLAEDRDGALWLGTNSGPARLDWRSAATVFDHQHSGLTDARATDIKRHDGVLYYLSNDGLYRLAPASDARAPARFERDDRVNVQVRLSSLLSTPGGLLLAGGQGLQRLTVDGSELLVAIPDGLVGLTASRTQPERIYFAHGKGVGTGVFLPDGSYHHEGNIPGIEAECYDVIEDAQGVVWSGTVSKGVYRAERAAGEATWNNSRVTRFTTAEGLPADHGSIFLWDSSFGMLFDTAQGLYRFDAAAQRFLFHRELVAFESRKVVLNPVAAGAPGELWTNGILMTKEIPYPLLRLRAQPDGKFSATPPPAGVEEFFGPIAPHRIFWEPAGGGPGVLWAKGDFGLLRLDLAHYAAPAALRAPLIRSLAAEGRDLIFPRENPGRQELKFSREPTTITFASGNFEPVSGERFQTRLVGFNAEWNAPTPRNDIAYTNLEGGPFRFEVRRVNRQGVAGPIAAFDFTVTPPWPRSAAAYVVYGLLGIVVLYGLVRWRLRAAKQEQRRLENLVEKRTAELGVARDEAEAANRAKSTFLAHMSHELRTPLNGVIGYAQVLLNDRALAGVQRERVNIVHASGTHLLRLINDVLDFSKIEAGKIELRAARFHPGQLMREVASPHEAAATAKGLRFVAPVTAALPEFVSGDAQKLRQVLDNLLSNAVKFTRAGSVTLAVTPAGAAQWNFSITDTGVGLSEQALAQLFQPFAQAADRPAGESGTGLGLVITRRLVQLLGGELEVESRPGHGSRFAFTLVLPPLAAPTGPSRPPHAVTGYAGERRRVLIVDDHEVNRTLITDLLAPLGFSSDSYASAEEVLGAINTIATPDIAFVDVKLPGIDGLELTRRLRAWPALAAMPIVLTSASVLTFDATAATAAGSDDFLPKPFAETQLLTLLERLLGLTWERPSLHLVPAPVAPARALAVGLLAELQAAADAGDVTALRAGIARARVQQPGATAFLDQLEKLAASYQLERVRQFLRSPEAQS